MQNLNFYRPHQVQVSGKLVLQKSHLTLISDPATVVNSLETSKKDVLIEKW